MHTPFDTELANSTW